MKNRVITIIVCVCLVVSMILGVNLVNKDKKIKKSVYLAMGDYLTSIDNSFSDKYYESIKNEVKNYNKFLSRKSMTSSDLLRLLSVDTSIVFNGETKCVSSVLKESKIISISLGFNDVMNNVRYNSITNSYIYDVDVVNRLLATLQSNLFDIIELIYSLNEDVKLYVLSSYYPYPSVENNASALYDDLNNSIMSACEDGGANYIDISHVSSIEYIDEGDVIPNEKGMEYIASLII